MAADDWTEKYRPQALKDIVGNPSSAAAMKQWAEDWVNGKPKFKALVLIGTPGIGKTSSAEALAREMGWGIVEMNASDQRTGSAIENVAIRASGFNTFGDDGEFLSTKQGGMKLIVLDEADSLYGMADKGAMPAIVELINNTKQPVILICNDFYELSRKSSAIKNDTLQITFRKPQAKSIEKVLRVISAKERFCLADEAAQKIAENADGDLRAAIRDLQSLALGKKEVTAEMADHLSERENRSDMFQFISALFRKRDAAYAKQLLWECDTDPKTVSLWIDENIPRECATKAEREACYNVLSRADVYLGRVSKRMYYGLWSYANDLMVEGIISCLTTPVHSYDRIMFPSYLSKMSRSKSSRALRKSLGMKLGYLTHTSGNMILKESMTFFKTLATDDEDFRVFLIKEGGLEDTELAFLLGVKSDSKLIKSSFLKAYPPEPKPEKKKTTRAKKAAEPAPTIEVPAPVKTEPPAEVPKAEPAPVVEKPAPAPDNPAPEKKPEPKAKQRSLFDF